jgi:hypothetical protein
MCVNDSEGIALAAVPSAEVPFEIHAPGRMGTGDIGKRLCRGLGRSHSARAWRRRPNSRQSSAKLSRPRPAFQRFSHSKTNFTRSFIESVSFQGMSATVRDVLG